MSELKVSPMSYQVAALTDFTTRFLGVSGGKRSGKSRMITCLKSIMLSSLHPGKPGLIASPVYGMTRRNILGPMRELADELKLDIEGLHAKSPDSLKIRWGDKISTIWLDCTIENYNRLNGLSLAWACVDEIDVARFEDAEAFIEELTIRISNPYPGQVAQINITGAPEMAGFLHEYFVDKKSDDKKIHYWSMMQNEMLSDEYKRSILATIPPSKQEGWIKGLPMHNSDGRVYEDYDPILNHTDLTLKDIHSVEDIWCTFDINAGGINVYMMVNRGRFTFVIKEWPKLSSVDAVIEKVKLQPWAKQAIITTDPACTQVLPYIEKSGLRHKIMTSAPPIEWRVTSLNVGFGTEAEFTPGVMKRRLLINTNECKILNTCLLRQGYIKGQPDKKTWIESAGTDISGPVDGLGYAYYQMYPFRADNIRKQISIRGF